MGISEQSGTTSFPALGLFGTTSKGPKAASLEGSIIWITFNNSPKTDNWP